LLWLDGVACQTPELILPHPRAHLRAFVLVPWCELAPELLLHDHELRWWLAQLPAAEIESVSLVEDASLVLPAAAASP
jgi:7,8-dihydro-6-hydroxymethylpterin-pyrophosphokinase